MLAVPIQAIRQQLLVVHLQLPSLASPIVAWSRYDGAGVGEGAACSEDEPPYASALAAMRDGWRVVQIDEERPHDRGDAYVTAYLRNRVVLERLVEASP